MLPSFFCMLPGFCILPRFFACCPVFCILPRLHRSEKTGVSCTTCHHPFPIAMQWFRLHCNALQCLRQHCIAMQCFRLHCNALEWPVMHWCTPFSEGLFYFSQVQFSLQCTALCNTELNCSAPSASVLYWIAEHWYALHQNWAIQSFGCIELVQFVQPRCIAWFVGSDRSSMTMNYYYYYYYFIQLLLLIHPK